MADPSPVDPVYIEDAMPLPTDPKVIYLGGLFFLALTAALYVGGDCLASCIRLDTTERLMVGFVGLHDATDKGGDQGSQFGKRRNIHQ